MGRLERIIDEARGATTVMTHDAAGRVLTRTDPLGHVTAMTNDIRGAMATQTDARAHTTTFAQTPLSSSSTNPLGHTTTSARTSYGLPGATTYPGGHSTSASYLGDTALDASTQFPLTQVDESSRTRSFGYDAQSVLQTATDLGGNAWTYGHTRVMAGDVTWDVQSGDVGVAVDGARAPVTRYSYRDQARDGHRPQELDGWVDRLSQVTSPEGEVTTWSFGPGGEIARVDYPFGGALTRTFDAAQRVLTETRPFGTTLTFARDAAGRVTGRTGSDGSAQSRTYLSGDRTDTVTDATGTTTYAYDAAGRFAGLDQPSGAGIAYDRDALDQVTSVTVHGDAAVDTRTFESAYTYDPNGNLSSVTDPFGRVTTYAYDAADRLTVMTLPNGVTSTYGYDDRDRVTSVVHADSSGAVLASVTYVRAPSGEPTRITREDGSYVTIGYDAALRVERESYHDASDVLVEEITYTYDADGNRTSRTTAGATDTYVYGSGSRLLRVEQGGSPTQTFSYDGGGRVTRIERSGRDYGLTYDADDHVVQLEDASTGLGARWAFDADGRRVGRTELASGTPGDTLSWANAPTLSESLDAPHATLDGAGAARTGYVFDGEHALARYDAGTTEPVYYLRDAMGSVIGVVDSAGTTSARIEYDGFGNVRREDGALAALPPEGGPRFQGMWLESTGLYYVRARVYDPGIGRFTSRDPAGPLRREPEGRHAYGFSRSGPFSYRDPTGRAEVSLAAIQIASFAAFSLATVAVGILSGGDALPVPDLELPEFGPWAAKIGVMLSLSLKAAEIRRDLRIRATTTNFEARPEGCQRELAFEVGITAGGVEVSLLPSYRRAGSPSKGVTVWQFAGYLCTMNAVPGIRNFGVAAAKSGVPPPYFGDYYDSPSSIPPSNTGPIPIARL